MPRHITIITRPPVFTNGIGALVINFNCSVNGGNAQILEDKSVVIPSSQLGAPASIHDAIVEAAHSELGGVFEDDLTTLFGGVIDQRIQKE